MNRGRLGLAATRPGRCGDTAGVVAGDAAPAWVRSRALTGCHDARLSSSPWPFPHSSMILTGTTSARKWYWRSSWYNRFEMIRPGNLSPTNRS